MADAGKEAAPEVTPQPTTAPSPVKEAPTAKATSDSGVVVRCAHPTSKFHVEPGFPVITKAGVKLDSGQVEQAKEAAERSGVRLIVDDGGK